MLDNCNYNKVRLLHDLSRLVWYLKKHAKKDARGKHNKCAKIYKDLEKDLEKYIKLLNSSVKKNI